MREPQRVVKVPLGGGLPVTIAEISGGFGASWGPDDTIVIGSYSGLIAVPAAGGTPQPLTTLADGEVLHTQPWFLPNGRAVLFQLIGGGESQVAVYSFDTGEHQVLLPGSVPRYLPGGHLVFVRGNTVWAVAFDADRLTLQGEPVPMVENVNVGSTGIPNFDVSRNGARGYIPGESVGARRLVWVDRAGREELVGIGPGLYDSPRISPNGLFSQAADGTIQAELLLAQGPVFLPFT